MNLGGKTILVTAGPTCEPFDAVRFISNFSSGKMGYAIAEKLAAEGVKVMLVSGPVSLKPVHKNIQLYKVQTAVQMLERCLEIFPSCDGGILSAAVADYRPKSPLKNKLKRKAENLTIEMVPNPDIAATLGKMKRPDQFLAGFALETDDEINNATGKMIRKNFDFIVLNSLQDEGSGFNSDTNKITIIGKDNKMHPFQLKSKQDVASDIVQFIDNLISK